MQDFIDSIGISINVAMLIVVAIIAAIILTRVSRWMITRSFEAASAKLNIDPTRYKFFKNMIAMIIWLITIGFVVLLVPKFKAVAITLFASAGIFVAIVGFAAQAAFANIISGVFIVMFKPFRVGDMIRVGSLDIGIVEDITLRHTVITSFENKRIIIPNSVVSSDTIVNDSIEDSRICKYVEVGISYDSNVVKAMKIMQEVAMSHPGCIDNRTEEEKETLPQVEVRLINFGDSSQNLRAYVWTDDPVGAYKMHAEINLGIKQRFDNEGIEIPYPYRTIVYKKDLDAGQKS